MSTNARRPIPGTYYPATAWRGPVMVWRQSDGWYWAAAGASGLVAGPFVSRPAAVDDADHNARISTALFEGEE